MDRMVSYNILHNRKLNNLRHSMLLSVRGGDWFRIRDKLGSSSDRHISSLQASYRAEYLDLSAPTSGFSSRTSNPVYGEEMEKGHSVAEMELGSPVLVRMLRIWMAVVLEESKQQGEPDGRQARDKLLISTDIRKAAQSLSLDYSKNEDYACGFGLFQQMHLLEDKILCVAPRLTSALDTIHSLQGLHQRWSKNDLNGELIGEQLRALETQFRGVLAGIDMLEKRTGQLVKLVGLSFIHL